MTSWFGDFSVAALFEVWQHPSKKACREALSVVCSQAHSDSWISPMLQEELCIHWGEYFIGNGHGDFLGNSDAISLCRQAVGRRPVQAGFFFFFFWRVPFINTRLMFDLKEKEVASFYFTYFLIFGMGSKRGKLFGFCFVCWSPVGTTYQLISVVPAGSKICIKPLQVFWFKQREDVQLSSYRVFSITFHIISCRLHNCLVIYWFCSFY